MNHSIKERSHLLQKISDDEFDMVYDIMKRSFPVDEYRPYAEQKALLGNSMYSIYAIPDTEDNRLKAFITVWKFEDFAYIEHFAVNSIYRNEGLGTLILQEISEIIGCRICLEVELPATDIARRRIGFYVRNGFFINDYEYIQPPISEGKNPIPLRIMTFGGSISKEDFEHMKGNIYREVYGVFD